MLDALSRRAHHERPDYLNPAADYVFADLVDERAVDQARGRGRRGVPPGRQGRAGRRLRRRDRLRRPTTRWARRRCCARCIGVSSTAGSCSRRAWWSTARAATSCAEHGRVATACPRSEQDLAAGRFEPPCPQCGRAARTGRRRRGRASRPAQRLRGHQGSPGTPLPGLRDRLRRRGGAASLPQRLRSADARDTPYAGVASIVRSAYEAGRQPRRSSRTGGSAETSCTSTTWPARIWRP